MMDTHFAGKAYTYISFNPYLELDESIVLGICRGSDSGYHSKHEAQRRLTENKQLYDKLRETHGQLKEGQFYKLDENNLPEYIKN